MTTPKSANAAPRSFFGGDPSMAHFAIWVRRPEEFRRANEPKLDLTNLILSERGNMVPDYSERRAWGKAGTEWERNAKAKLKELGFKTRYFQFRTNDEAGKAKAKQQAEQYAAEWTAKTGFEFEVSEGCFL